MDAHYPTIDQPATPEYVLAVLRDMQRQRAQYRIDEDDGTSWTMETTIDEWCDFGWPKLGRALNEFWGINCSDAEWRAVLEPEDQKRLGDVCELIARYARREVIRPVRLFGCICRPAGAFLTVRSLLREAGASVEEIAPSTPLAAYTRRYAQVFLGPISQLAPGALPLVRVRNPMYDAGLLGSFFGLVIVAISGCSGLTLLAIIGAAMFVTGWALTWIAACWMLPASVEFGELRTFRDLAQALSHALADRIGDIQEQKLEPDAPPSRRLPL
jgi:hypothetical protein